MALFEQVGRFLEQGVVTLDDVRASLKEARDTLVALRPTVEALPALVRDTHALVIELKRTAAARST
jgi:hypothetical protein